MYAFPDASFRTPLFEITTAPSSRAIPVPSAIHCTMWVMISSTHFSGTGIATATGAAGPPHPTGPRKQTATTSAR